MVTLGTGWETAPRSDVVEGSTDFEAFFDAHQDRLFRSLCVITGSRHEAEDVTQEAFVKVWERWSVVSSMENPAGYLRQVALNTVRSRYRRAKVALQRTFGVLPPHDVFEAVEARHDATRALKALTPRQRAALVLTDAYGYGAAEAGRLLGVRPSTVRALHSQALAALRGTLGGKDV